MAFTNKQRMKLYESGKLEEVFPQKINPKSHTMTEEGFQQYIGRHKAEADQILSKKFSEDQKDYLRDAYRSGHNVRVIGAYVEDISKIATLNGLEIIPDSMKEYRREARLSNLIRPTMFLARKAGEGPVDNELWVAVFPSSEYVDQVSELIQAIYDDFERCEITHKNTPKVTVTHFPRLEEGLAGWTGFDQWARTKLRHGDVVVFGNLDFLLSGFTDVGFEFSEPAWQFGGVGNMFRYRTIRQRTSGARIALFGFDECFWGSAIGHYTTAMINAGARHILYGSKAATIIEEEDIHKIYAPEQFLNISRTGEDDKVEHIANAMHKVGYFAESFKFVSTGYAVTVPTVCGEDKTEMETYRMKGAVCMDCENAHIAKAIRRYNEIVEAERLEDDVNFLPIHFITDYIHDPRKELSSGRYNLATHSDNAEYKTRRDKSFRRIGQFFAIYGLMYSNRDMMNIPSKIPKKSAKYADFVNIMRGVRKMVNEGFGKEAVNSLVASHKYDETSFEHLACISLICQKYGYTTNAMKAINQIRANIPDARRFDVDFLSRIGAIELKIYSQLGAYRSGLQLGKSLVRGAVGKATDETKQFGSVMRRMAVCAAGQGDFGEADDYIQRAISAAAERDSGGTGTDHHYHETNNLYFELVEYSKAEASFHAADINETSLKLSNIRRSYFTGDQDEEKWWQTNYQKCAVGSLFLDGAFELLSTERDSTKKAIRKLYIASLLSARTGGSNTSETFGEISSITNNARHKSIITLAMRRDSPYIYRFRDFVFSVLDVSESLTEKEVE